MTADVGSEAEAATIAADVGSEAEAATIAADVGSEAEAAWWRQRQNERNEETA